MTESDWSEYRRRLPHMRLIGATYFVTWRLHSSQPDLSEVERQVIWDSLLFRDGDRYDLVAYVVMNDHAHALVSPLSDWSLDQIVQPWKSFTAHVLSKKHRRVAPIWQEESFDRIVRSDEELFQKVEYILNNPVKRWPDIGSYPWVGAKGSLAER